MDDSIDINEIKKFIYPTNLEDSVRAIYSSGRARPLYGNNSVMLKTLGNNFQGPDSYQKDYFDHFKYKKAMTEFAEFCESLKNYDNLQSRNNLIEVLLEAGDLLFQSVVLDLRHQGKTRYQNARSQMDKAMSYVAEELIKRGLSMDLVRKLARIKYGVRSFMIFKGLPPKNKDLEKRFCLEELNESQK